MPRITQLSLAVLGALLLAGCSVAAPQMNMPPSTSSAATDPAPSATPDPTPSETAVPHASSCTAHSLEARLGRVDGVEGGSVVEVMLENTSDQDCMLQGWPGVSMVTNGDGTQLGAASGQDAASPNATVTLAASGGLAAVSVEITNALDFSNAECGPRDADGLRLYPPGATGALFVAVPDLVGCSSGSVDLLVSGAMQPA